jgi:hypothetical protein
VTAGGGNPTLSPAEGVTSGVLAVLAFGLDIRRDHLGVGRFVATSPSCGREQSLGGPTPRPLPRNEPADGDAERVALGSG